MENPARAETLQFSAFHSSVDEGFWHRLSHLKLNQYGIDDSPISVTGFIAPCSHPKISNYLTLLSESLPPPKDEESDIPATSLSNRNRCPVPGTLCNTNTFEGFKDLDRENLLKVQARKIWDDIESGAAIEDCSLLLRFLLISFADLKKWSFHYWFAFPSLVLDHSIRLDQLKPASECFYADQAKSLSLACNNWRKSSATADVPFFIISFDSSGHASIEQLRNLESCRDDMDKLWFGFYDPCHEAKKPGWPLRNFIALIHKKWSLKSIRFFCYREARGFADMKLSLVGEAEVCAPLEWTDLESATNPVGWELYKNEAVPRCITLAKSMDPVLLAESATDLNLKLMRWRALPSLDLNHLSSLKCLLLGAGTLGCEVARILMAWGIRKITLVDNGRVAMSNPVRQSLYTFEDCLNGGDYKALAAAKSLKRIFPAVEAEGVVMTIPMPGHSDTHEKDRMVDDCKCLHDLIDLHDVIFLLTDTRESRWLPSLLCANSNKITINAALGFDSFLVMRHGPGPLGPSQGNADSISSGLATLSVDDKNEKQRLGCYFCNDVVAPTNSINNRTLDQQCTVTRPGLAPMASAHAVELLLALLHHPQGIYAEGEQASANMGGRGDESLGLLPHQIRGSVYHCSLMTLIGHASSCCTACSKSVISEYRNRGMEFLLEAIKNPTYLEDLTGITDLMRSANSFAVDWDDSSRLMDDEDCVEI